MQVTELEIPGLLLFEPQVFGDDRGYFMETWNAERYRKAGLDVEFVQTNVSRSARGVLRGLHFQNPNPQGKLVYVLEGEVWDVAVDIRRGSPDFGRWAGATLSKENHHQLYVPPGFAHGFCVMSDYALFGYHCTTVYHGPADSAVRWDDPAIGIEWPLENPSLSAKDAAAPLLAELDPERLPEL
ncbi:MAG: dTDP-4-dehydrorhamnose 3,5-epimerase [Xanthomonadales bacterium]|nr:dTDP-4-dehydrorhamnose 3,5-epimerase [Xanthomonadales bacterium]